MFSAVFEPPQLESWLMSILAGLGAAPSNFTVPLTLAVVAGLIGVAAGAAAGAGAAGCSSAVSFLPHPASKATPSKTDRLPIASDLFVFILFLPLPCKYQNSFERACYLGAHFAEPPAAPAPEEPPPVEAAARPMDELTRRCSSGVSWKIYSTRSLVWSLSYPLKDAGVGPEKVQRLFSRLKRPEGMEVPGLMACGSIIQRSTQSGLRRPLAWRKLGAVAVLSCAGSPVAWHFKQGAAVLLKRLRAMSVSLVVRMGISSGMYGKGWRDSAWKKRTNLPSSFSEKENVGMRTWRYERTPLRLLSLSFKDGFFRKRNIHSGSTRAPSVRSLGGSCSCTSW